MSHHDPAPHVQRRPKPTIQDRLWGTQQRLHDVARRLDRPGPHGATYASDLYDILGVLTAATADIQEIIRRATRLLTDASDHGLTTRPYAYDGCVWLQASELTARNLTRTLDNAQTAISDIGGHLLHPDPPATDLGGAHVATHPTPRDSTPAALPARPVGSFHYGIVRHNRPHTLSTWRATSPHPRIARRLAELLGGHPQPDPVSGQVEVITATDALDILLTGPEALDVRWQRGARHACDGITQRDAQSSRPCTCPAALNERKTTARRSDGCTPRTLLRFQLVLEPELGMFTFTNGTWSFVHDATTALRLQLSGKPAVARLSLMRTPYASASEPTVVYTRPTLTLVRAPTRRRRRPHRRASSAPTRT